MFVRLEWMSVQHQTGYFILKPAFELFSGYRPAAEFTNPGTLFRPLPGLVHEHLGGHQAFDRNLMNLGEIGSHKLDLLAILKVSAAALDDNVSP